MRPKWAFQLLPSTRDILGKGYRVDSVTQKIEDEVNAVLQCKFDFHGISKLVIRLGPKDGTKDYHEHIGVAQKYYPNFDICAYKELDDEAKREAMIGIIKDVFNWLAETFDDAQIFQKAQTDCCWK